MSIYGKVVVFAAHCDIDAGFGQSKNSKSFVTEIRPRIVWNPIVNAVHTTISFS
jgi:hypothetical protein